MIAFYVLKRKYKKAGMISLPQNIKMITCYLYNSRENLFDPLSC